VVVVGGRLWCPRVNLAGFSNSDFVETRLVVIFGVTDHGVMRERRALQCRWQWGWATPRY